MVSLFHQFYQMSLRTQIEKVKWKGKKREQGKWPLGNVDTKAGKIAVAFGTDEERSGAGFRGIDSNLPQHSF